MPAETEGNMCSDIYRLVERDNSLEDKMLLGVRIKIRLDVKAPVSKWMLYRQKVMKEYLGAVDRFPRVQAISADRAFDGWGSDVLEE